MNADRRGFFSGLATLVVAFSLCVPVQGQDDPAQLEAVIETSKGTIVMRFFPKEAPRHVAHFIETARAGGFNGTTFFRAIPYAVIQGGDPNTKDPKKRALYGTGGLRQLPDETSSLKHE